MTSLQSKNSFRVTSQTFTHAIAVPCPTRKSTVSTVTVSNRLTRMCLVLCRSLSHAAANRQSECHLSRFAFLCVCKKIYCTRTLTVVCVQDYQTYLGRTARFVPYIF